MKIGIFFNGDPKEGGNYQHAISMMQKVKKINPDYFLVLPWHFRDFIIKKEKKYINSGRNLIFPLPDIEII